MTRFIDFISSTREGKALLQRVGDVRKKGERITSILDQKPELRDAYNSIEDEDRENLIRLTTGLNLSNSQSSSADWNYMSIILSKSYNHLVAQGDVAAHRGQLMHELTHIQDAYLRTCSQDTSKSFDALNGIKGPLSSDGHHELIQNNLRIANLKDWEFLWMEGLKSGTEKNGCYLGDHEITFTEDVGEGLYNVGVISHVGGVSVDDRDFQLEPKLIDLHTQPKEGFIRPYGSLWRGAARNLGSSMGMWRTTHSFYQEDNPTIVEMFHRNKQRFLNIMCASLDGGTVQISNSLGDEKTHYPVLRQKARLLVELGYLPKVILTNLL